MSRRDKLALICERFREELLELVGAEPINPQSAPVAPEWLTAQQLAEYWQLRNGRGQQTTSGILKWAKRDPKEFPLPHAYMGDLIRFHRTEVDQWAREEAQRRRSGRIRPPAQAGDVTSTEAAAGSKLRSTLTAVGLTKKEKAYAGI